MFLLPKLSQLHLFGAVDTSLSLKIFKQSEKKAMANNKAAIKISRRPRAKYEGLATLCVMVIHSRGKLKAYF